MSKGKLFGIGALLIIVVIAGALYFTLSNLDSLVKKAIEAAGTHVTQTNVAVNNVKIGLTDGTGAINGLTVNNPAGFSGGKIFSLGGIAVKIDPKTVTQDPIIIPEVIISSPKVLYEINQKGKSNLDALKANIQQSIPKGGGGSDSGGSGSKAPGIIIRKLVVEGGQADIKLNALMDKEMSAKLPRIQLNNIGEKKGGATPAEIGQQVLNAMTKNLSSVVSGLGIEKLVNEELKKKLGDVKGAAEKAVGENIDKLKDAGGGAVGEQTEKAKDALKGILGN